jgi:hypothetical protein
MPAKPLTRGLLALVATLSLVAVSCSSDDGSDVRELDSDSSSEPGSGSSSEPAE